MLLSVCHVKPREAARYNRDKQYWYPAAAARVLDGKAIALEWEKSIAAEAAQLSKELGRKPGLAVIIAGSRPDSAIYVQRKQDACKRVRMHWHRQAGCHCVLPSRLHCDAADAIVPTMWS